MVNGIRYHQTPLGLLPGVTSVLDNTKNAEDQRAIDSWMTRVGEQEAKRIKDEACARGTKLHVQIESYLKAAVIYDDPLFKLIFPLLNDLGKTHYIESNTHHTLGYGGSPDLIAEYNGNLTIFDWKTSTKVKRRSYCKDYLLQVSAYIQSANETFGLNIDRGVVALVTPSENSYYMYKITPTQYKKYVAEFNERLVMFQDRYSPLF